MNNLKINDKFENFIAKLPYNSNTNEGGGVLIIHEIEGDPPTTSKTRYRPPSGTSYYLDKTFDEILNACENDIPIIKQTDIIDGGIENILCLYMKYRKLDEGTPMKISIFNNLYNITENNYLIRLGSSEIEH